MPVEYPYKVFACGDHAVTIDFGNVINTAVNQTVLHLFGRVKQQNITWVKDVIPAYSSITVVYDMIAVRVVSATSTAFDYVCAVLGKILADDTGKTLITGKLVKIPACYEQPFAPDLAQVAQQKGIPLHEVIRLHTAITYRVYMLGFLPGFAYMGTVDSKINTPRKTTPRLNIPAGSIGIAGMQTGIYPVQSPGGWNIIAATPLILFDAAKTPPALLQPGDEVQFYPVTVAEFNHFKNTPWAC
ncbi:MAG TPA: 5-oxoprolinase subunit PxpB [Chitinophagaceae bacterium]|nr:5-oxoprolinase subunit PxpB [Chitinophagaceae bacterium]